MIPQFVAVLHAARNGDEWAWTTLYDSIATQMLGYLKGRGAVDPEGLVGDAFLQISRNLGTFDGDEAGFRSWAFTVAHHRLIDERRRLTKRPRETTLPESRFAGWQAPDDVASQAIDSVDRSTIERLLKTLSEAQRNVILLRILGGLTARETAAAIGKSEGSVRVLQHRALSALREQLNRDVTL